MECRGSGQVILFSSSSKVLGPIYFAQRGVEKKRHVPHLVAIRVIAL